jgi:hypothetical protein
MYIKMLKEMRQRTPRISTRTLWRNCNDLKIDARFTMRCIKIFCVAFMGGRFIQNLVLAFISLQTAVSNSVNIVSPEDGETSMKITGCTW